MEANSSSNSIAETIRSRNLLRPFVARIRAIAVSTFLGLNAIVPEQQLHLFDAARPLLERFGAAFFKAVPPRPGVYIMSGEEERMLYIGQSGNLRRRLGSYKNARPDRAPRKIVRLIHAVRSLVWEECETVAAARLKENQLLRTHRPKFNVQNTYPRAYRYISADAAGDELRLRLTSEPLPDAASYGAFKGASVYAFGALLRLLWAAFYQPLEPYEFPRRLLQLRAPRDFVLNFPATRSSKIHWAGSPSAFATDPLLQERMTTALHALLAGESAGLITMLSDAIPQGREVHVFQQNLLVADIERLSGLYEHGAKRNRELLQRHGLGGTIISPETLDDLLAQNSEIL